MSRGRLVILGSTGFVGSHVLESAIECGWDVLGISSSVLDLQSNRANVKLASLLAHGDVLIHAAAIAPAKTAEDVVANLRITQAVADAVDSTRLSHLIVVSSDAVYGSGSGLIQESSPCNPDSLHGVMSLARELVLARNNGVTVLRSAPIYGVGDTHNSYGPNRFVRQGIAGQDVALFGAGEAVRDHVHVSDVVSVILHAADTGPKGIVNVASGESLSFAAVAEIVISACDRVRIVATGSEESPTFRSFDISGLVRLFPGFEATSPQEGIITMIDKLRSSAQ